MAVDGLGASIAAIETTAYTQVIISQSASPTLVYASGGDPAAIAAAVWTHPDAWTASTGAASILDALLSGHFLPDSVGEALALIRGMTQSNYVLDNTTYNASGLLTAGRMRIFPSAVSAAAATPGGSGQGELASFSVAVTAVGAEASFYRVVRL